MNLFFLDFETRSKLDLKQVGAENYARDPSTEVISIAYAHDNSSPVEHRKSFSGQWPLDKTFVAHNIEFERAILEHIYRVSPKHWIDTMALAAQLSLPLGLADLAEFFGLAKDETGQKSMKKLSRPRPKSRANPNRDKFWEYEDKPEDFESMFEYNENDVYIMREIFKKLLPLTTREQRIWELTQEMNDRGIQVDVPAVRRALELVNAERATLEDEFQNLVGCTSSSAAKIAEFCGLPDIRKQTVEAALKPAMAATLTPAVRRALQLRQLLGRSSLAKLDSMLLRASPDGRLRGSLVYAGAQRTGRWAGRGVQPQNFRRGMGEDSETAVDCMVEGWRSDSWLKLMPDMLRSFFKGPYIVGDFAQIEARVLAWFAKESLLIEEFVKKSDIYRTMASIIYGLPVDRINGEQRRIGKNTVLGCGFQMGPDRYVSQLAAQGIPDFPRHIAARAVDAYRERYAKIPQFWWYINNQALEAMYGRSGKWFETCSVRGVRYLRCRLPSGRHLYYPKPRLGTDPKYGTERVEYWGQNTYTRQWEYVGSYGGKWTENIVQGTARDLLVDAMFRVRDRGGPISLCAHDEIVAERNGSLSAAQLASCMKQLPEWASGIPIDVEVFECERYRK